MGLLNKIKNMNVQAKAAIWFAACSILQKGISFVTVPIFTRLLTAEQYGTYSLYLSWLQILTIITSLNIFWGVFNNGIVKYDDNKDVFTSSMQGLTLTITSVVFIVYVAAFNFWSELLGLSPLLIFLMFIEMAVTPSLQFWSARQRFDFKYKKLVFITLAKSALNPALGIIMVLFAEDKSTARILSVVIIEVIFCGIIMLMQFIKGKCFIKLKYWKYAITLAIPLLPHYLSSMILNQGDRVMIDQMAGKSEVAFYSVAYNIGMLVQIVTTAILSSFTPWIYLKFKAKEMTGVKKTISALLLIVSSISFVLMLCSPELVLIFGSEEYRSACYVIPPVAASVFFIFLYNILALPQFYYEKTKFLAISSILSAVLNVILNYIFISIFGFVAAGYTTLICYILYSLGHFFVSQIVLKKHFKNNQMFDQNFTLLLSLIMIITVIGCNFIFDFWYIRYAIMLGVVIVLFIKRAAIISLIGGLRKK